MNNDLLLKNIKKNFGTKTALNNINLLFNHNKINGLLGPNGSGKTTLFNIIAGFILPDKGDVTFNGEILNDKSLHQRSELGISYLPQEPSIFRGMNVEDNLLSIIEIVEKDKNKQNIILESLLNEFDINHVRKSKSIVLSGGERRRLEIARTLASKPKYLLLDEPLTGIDPVSIEEIKIIIKKLKQKNIGVLITDHNVRETLKIVDKVYIVNEGMIFFSGNPNEAISDDRIKKFYLGSDFSI